MKYSRILNLLVLTTGMSIWGPAAAGPLLAQSEARCEIRLPNEKDSVRFAVAGDAGTGESKQRDVARQMTICHTVFPFDFVLMPGDNLYGSEKPKDYRTKFEEPFADLLKAGVKFYAALGNHDNPEQRFYKNFNMKGERYYSFEEGPAKLVALDSTYMSPEQLEWTEKELRDSDKKWKIVFFHHPIYSSGGRHGSDLELRKVLEPLFVQYGVDVVIAGHEHFYERTKPQKEITYFISGAAGKLRKGNVRKTDLTAASFDADRSFMLVEVAGDTLHFQSISRTGETVDSGTVTVREADDRPTAAEAGPARSNREKRGENP